MASPPPLEKLPLSAGSDRRGAVPAKAMADWQHERKRQDVREGLIPLGDIGIPLAKIAKSTTPMASTSSSPSPATTPAPAMLVLLKKAEEAAAGAAYLTGVFQSDTSRHIFGKQVMEADIDFGNAVPASPQEALPTMEVAYFVAGTHRKGSIADLAICFCQI